jgi:hypothetical protein
MAAEHSPSKLSPTRQQLDELEALIQRMLTVPVNQLDDEPEYSSEGQELVPALPSFKAIVPTPSPVPESISRITNPEPPSLARKTYPGAASDEPRVELAAVHAPTRDIAPEAGKPEFEPSPFPEPPIVDNKPLPESRQVAIGQELPAVNPDREPAHETTTVFAGFANAPPADVSRKRKARDPVGSGPWLWPILWCNQAFDSCVGLLGPPGRWLQSASGRAFLGAAGLLLLSGALAWAILGRMAWPR